MSRLALYRSCCFTRVDILRILATEEALADRFVLIASCLQESGEPASITDIAYACGYNELSTFYRHFKSHFKKRPQDFRL